MKFVSLFKKPEEIQLLIADNIKAAYLGHIIFPLSYALLSDVLIRDKKYFLYYIAFFSINSFAHFLLGLLQNRILLQFGKKFWLGSYFTTIFLEALSFVIPVYYAIDNYGFWSPQCLYTLLVVIIGLEGFAKYCYAYFEGFLVGSGSLMLPIILGLPLYGKYGASISLVAAIYYGIVIKSAWIANELSNNLIIEKNNSEQSRLRNKELLNLLPLKVFLLSKEFKIKMGNKDFLQDFGIEEELNFEKIDSDDYELLKNWEKSVSNTLKEKIQKAFENQSDNSFEYLIDLGQGKKWYYLSITRSSAFNIFNEEENYIIAAIDIHENKLSQEELENQRLINLNSSKLASLGEMAGGIAHEINNPLAIILGNVAYLLKRIEKGKLDEETLITNLNKTEQVGFRMKRIISGMRNLIRDDSTEDAEQFHIKDLIEDSIGLCEERFKSSNVTLKVGQISETKVYCNYPQIGQILVNLLNNAHDVLLDFEDREVEIKTVDEDDFLYLQVFDSGPGVKNTDKLFQPFYTTKPVGKGTGLGLSLSKKLAKKNGGDLFYSRDNGRSLFQVQIPIAKALKKAS